MDVDQMDYLLDEIELDNDQQVRRESDESMHHTLLSEVISEWNTHLNQTPLDRCNGKHKCSQCKASKRLKFILRYYSEWIDLKCSSQKQDEDMPSPTISSTPLPSAVTQCKASQVMAHFDWISDFFFELTNYSSYDLCNDLTHVLRHHLLQGNPKQQSHTQSFFTSDLGSCDDTSCPCYLRAQRDMNIDNMMESKRKANYFVDMDELPPSKQKASPFKINNEIHLQQIVDKIHCTLLHQQQKKYMSNSFKYMSRISRNQHYMKSKGDIKLGKYTFGSSITYWDSKHHRYCAPKYADLRAELLKNNVYALSPEMYTSLKSKAIHFLNTAAGQKYTARREHDWMKQFVIPRGSAMSVDHVIALLCYCNVACLQRAYKRHGYQREGRTREDLLAHHSSIWHYSRLLLESVHCYGMPLAKDCKYYHGIDTALIFDRYNLMIDVPLSVTTAKDIGYNFSDIDGITVEFGHGGLSDLQSLCLDLSPFSDNPIECEYLLFHSFVSIRDICMKRLHHEQWLAILRFWHRVNEGFFHQHLVVDDTISRNDQLCICAMVQNMIVDPKNDKYDHRIPQYMQKLFNVLGNNGFFWMIRSEYDALIPKLQKYLITADSPFLAHLSKRGATIRSAQVFEWAVSQQESNRLLLTNHPWIRSESYQIFINEKRDHLVFHFEVQDKPKSGLMRCRIHLDDKPSYVDKLTFGNGLFCHELQFDNYSYGELTEKRNYNMSLHSLFQTKLLKNIAFHLTLQIQIFEIKNRKGQTVSINPFQ
eukprot:29071_1